MKQTRVGRGEPVDLKRITHWTRVEVRYSDLDVSTVAGATALYQRLQGAAHFVCGAEGRSLAEQDQWRGCVRSAVGQAVSAVHSPALSAIDADGARPMQTALLRR